MSGPGDDDSSWDDPPKPLSNGSGTARGKASLEELKLVPRTPPRNSHAGPPGPSASRAGAPALGTPALAAPNRSNTMIGLGAVKPPGGPLPSPLQGLSSAMARVPGEVTTKSVRRPTPTPSSAMGAPPPAAPAFADGAATLVDVARPAPPPAAIEGPAGASAPETVAPVGLEEATLIEDADGLSKAYLAPTSVPKAMLPSTEDDAKVVINIPTPTTSSNEEVTATIDRDALERQKVRDEQLDAQRRREPTQRIPRKAVQEARREIEERQARLATASEAALEMGEDPADVVVDSIRAIPSAPISNPPTIDDEPTASLAPTRGRPSPESASRGPSSRPAPRALDATVTESHVHSESDTALDDEPAPAPPRSTSGRSSTWMIVAAIVAAGAAGLFFMLRTPTEKAPDGASQAATGTQAPAKVTARPAGEPAAPPLQLTAEPKAPDPNAVHLDQQAAETPSPTPEPTTQPVAPVVTQPRIVPVKPANTYYTPTDI